MPTTYTAYDDAVTYDAVIRYDGVVTTADVVADDTGNAHAAVPWRNQRGRSNTFRRKIETPRVLSGVVPRIAIPKPEVTVSRAETKILTAPDRSAAERAITEFVTDRAMRQAKQPTLPDPTPTQSYTEPPKLPAETAGEQAAVRVDKARADYERRERDDDEVMTLVSLLEGF